MWTASTGTVRGYVVEISDDSGATYKFIYNVAGDVTQLALDDKCAYGITYSFRVSAWNEAGISGPSDAISWKRPGYEPPADAPLPTVNAGPAPAAPDGSEVQ